MVVKYKVEGTIKVNLNDDELEELESYKSETMKKAYLEQLITDKLYMCSLTAKHEFGYEINFEELHVSRDCKL